MTQGQKLLGLGGKGGRKCCSLWSGVGGETRFPNFLQKGNSPKISELKHPVQENFKPPLRSQI